MVLLQNKWYQGSENKSLCSVFAANRVKFNVELSCSEKALYNKNKETFKKIYKLINGLIGIKETA